jgi:hypothetical protein
MNLRLGASLFVIAGFAVLAACSGGGSGTSAVPSGSGSVLHPQTIVSTSSPVPTATPVPTPTPTPVAVTGTLYYSSADTAYAIPLNSNGAVTASRSIKPHAKENPIISGLATEADATLVVLQNYSDSNQVQHCHAAVMAADATSTTPPTRTIACSSDTANQQSGAGVSRNKQGGFDLFYGGSQQVGEFIQRYANDGTSLSDTLLIPDSNWWDTTIASATFASGHDYLEDGRGDIRKYLASDTSETSAEGNCVDLDPDGLYPTMAVAPDGTIYVVRKTSSQTPLKDMYIDAITSCPGGGAAATVSRTIGPFTQGFPTAMTVDAEGDLYVALEPTAGGASVINVYGRWANDSGGKKPAPMRVINVSPTVYEIRWLTLYDTTGQAAF